MQTNLYWYKEISRSIVLSSDKFFFNLLKAHHEKAIKTELNEEVRRKLIDSKDEIDDRMIDD